MHNPPRGVIRSRFAVSGWINPYFTTAEAWPHLPEETARRDSRRERTAISSWCSVRSTRARGSCPPGARCRSGGARRPTCASSMRWPRAPTPSAPRARRWRSRTWAAPTAPGCATSGSAHQRTAVTPGEAITIGTTILVVQRREPAFRPRRIWPHGYFETRLIEACAQAESASAAPSPWSGCTSTCRRSDGDPSGGGAGRDAPAPGDVLAATGPTNTRSCWSTPTRRAPRRWAPSCVERLGKGRSARPGRPGVFPRDGTSPRRWSAAPAIGCADRPPERQRRQRDRDGEPRHARASTRWPRRWPAGTINVLIVGETGVGKEILAETVHRLSPRWRGPLRRLNCAALSDSLLESELFGHEKGAFTGALQPKPGLLEAASAGRCSSTRSARCRSRLQAKLLRALETKQVMRVGATKPRPVDVRFVAATNRDLEEEIAAKTLPRGPLLPAQRHHPDHPAAARAHRRDPRAGPRCSWRRWPRSWASRRPPLSRARRWRSCAAYAWPGNIRELRNVMERALLLASGERHGRAPAARAMLPRRDSRAEPSARSPPTATATDAPAASMAADRTTGHPRRPRPLRRQPDPRRRAAGHPPADLLQEAQRAQHPRPRL